MQISPPLCVPEVIEEGSPDLSARGFVTLPPPQDASTSTCWSRREGMESWMGLFAGIGVGVRRDLGSE